MRTLVLGGTGVFGGRLGCLLANDPLIDLTIGARDAARVEALAAELGIGGLTLDRRFDLDRDPASKRYDALVHVAGPFQGQDYAGAEARIRHGVHYLDLSDDRAFVCGIDRLDAAAREARVLICSGASTAPALTGAVLQQVLDAGISIDRVVRHRAGKRCAARPRAHRGHPVWRRQIHPRPAGSARLGQSSPHRGPRAGRLPAARPSRPCSASVSVSPRLMPGRGRSSPSCTSLWILAACRRREAGSSDPACRRAGRGSAGHVLPMPTGRWRT